MTFTSAQATPPEYTYREFCDFVRRFNQEGLLTTVASTAVSLPATAEDPRFRRTPPWALAAVVTASICHGNQHRSTPVRPKDLAMACHIHNNLAPEELNYAELNSPFGILVRTAYEQFPYQESIFEEMARPVPFFDDYSRRKRLEVLTRQSLSELIGAPMRIAVGVAMLLHVAAQVNGGLFDPKWMDQPNFAQVLAEVPRDEVLAVINSVFANNFEQFRAQDREAAAKLSLPFLDRYRFSPLTARPLVQLADGRLLAPVPQLIPRKLSPLELYYVGLERWGTAFTRDMGELLEDYIGRQFKTLSDVDVHSEVTYKQGKNQLKSVDWLLVFPGLVVLLEAKAGRVPAGARAANATVQEAYSRVLGDGFRQINRSYRAILDRIPEFAHIPTDRPIIGMVGTLDPWYNSNSFARNFLPATEIPIVVADVRGIEMLVGIGQRCSAAQILREITDENDERKMWNSA